MVCSVSIDTYPNILLPGNIALTLLLAGLKSLKIVNEIEESFLLKVCETVRNRVADADLQDRCGHPDDFASVYLHGSQGGYQDYA